jgi:uncharacterized LabA/DUF88 family protein
MNTRVFIDFWNFQITWNERTNNAKCDWPRLPALLTQEAIQRFANAGLKPLSLQETRVYAGYEAGREANLKRWLSNFLDRQPGFQVITSERHWRERPVHCRICGTHTSLCPSCNAKFGHAAEKTIDGHIVTDLLGLAWENTYEVAILVSSDKDFIPAVNYLQTKNFKVINATWHGQGYELAKTCWASFEIDSLMSGLLRPPSSSP